MDQEFYKQVLDSMFDGVYFVDTQRRILYWNHGAEAVSGYRQDEVVGRSCRDNILMHVDDAGRMLCRDICPLGKTLVDGEARQAEVYLHHKQGHRIPVAARISAVRDAEGRIIGAVEIFADNTHRTRAAEEMQALQRLALLDALTGLGNRRYAEMTLINRLGELQRYGAGFSVMFVDVDDFKKVNDTFGHATGDKALVMIGRTMSGCLRGSDIVCRWGGEEFLVILPGVGEKELPEVAEKLRSLVGATWMDTPEGTVRPTVSIGGVTAAPTDTAATLVRRADELMYKSKNAGKNCVNLSCEI